MLEIGAEIRPQLVESGGRGASKEQDLHAGTSVLERFFSHVSIFTETVINPQGGGNATKADNLVAEINVGVQLDFYQLSGS